MIYDGRNSYSVHATVAAEASCEHGRSAGGATTPGETAAGDLCLKPSQYQMLQPRALDTMDLGQSSVVDPPDTPNTVPHQIPPLHGSGNLCSDGQLIDLPSQGSCVQQDGGGWRLTIRRSLDVAQPGAGSSLSVRQLLLRRPSADIIDAIRLGPLLGAGSFGKVYRAQLWGVAVAVKIMETQNAYLSAKVANELEVVMRLAHPNIVQALHIALWQRPAADSALLSATQDAAGFDLGVGDISDATTVTFTNSSSFCVGSQGSSTRGRASSSLRDAGALAGAAADPCLQRGLSDYVGGRDQAGAPAEGTTSSSTNTTSSSSPPQGVEHAGQAACPGHGHTAPRTKEAAAAAAPGCAGAESMGFGGQLEESRAWLVLELCDGGTLEEAIQAGRYMKHDGQPDMLLLLSHLLDIATGMAYLHEQHVLHADLKPANVLLCSPDGPAQRVLEEGSAAAEADGSCGTSPRAKAVHFQDMRLKISDFGLSHGMALGQSHHQTATVGTLSHMAPEVLQEGRLSTAADVYSFGVLMWEMVHGMRAFRGCFNEAQMLERVLSGERPAFTQPTTPGYVELTAACWVADAGQRPTFRKVVRRLNTLLQIEEQQRQLHRQTVRIGRPSLLLMEGSLSAGSDTCSTPRGAARRLSALLAAVSACSSAQQSPGSLPVQHPPHGGGVGTGQAEGSSHGSGEGRAPQCSGGCALGRASSVAAPPLPPPSTKAAAAAAPAAAAPASMTAPMAVPAPPEAGHAAPTADGNAGRGRGKFRFHRQLQQLQAQLHSWHQWRPEMPGFVGTPSRKGSSADRCAAGSSTSAAAATSIAPCSTQAAAVTTTTGGSMGASAASGTRIGAGTGVGGICSSAEPAGAPVAAAVEQEGVESDRGNPSSPAAAPRAPKPRRNSLLLDKGGYSGWW